MDYSRQILLPEVGLEGQKKLAAAKCLVIGAGGLGSPVLLYLSAAGIGKLGVCDGDFLEASNLHRQPIYSFAEIGQPKAEAASRRIKALNPTIEVLCHPVRLTQKNVFDLFLLYDLILDCTDNFQTKFLINDAGYQMQKPIIRASIYQFEGQLQTWLPMRKDACLRCLWPTTPEEGCVRTCAEVGVIGPTAGYLGLLQALEAMKWIIGLPILQTGEILLADLMRYSHQIVRCSPRPDCPLCGSPTSIPESSEIEWSDLEGLQLVDIREKEELLEDPHPIQNALHIPLSLFDAAEHLNPHTHYAFFCQKGKRSSHLVGTLRREGWSRVFSLRGGVEQIFAYEGHGRTQ